jgi:tRNA/rRNA methyltransferase
MNKPIIILVSPQMGENIGAVARVMKNFAFSELRLVAPRDGWPNEKANSMAVEAVDILKKAKIFVSLEDAISDINVLYAASARVRKLNKECVDLKQHFTQGQEQGKTAIMFGRENNGLNNEEVALAGKLIMINTNSEYSSLNLAQAVGVFCYEYFNHQQTAPKLVKEDKPATLGEVNGFLDNLLAELADGGFFRIPAKRSIMVNNLKSIFTRIQLSAQEVKTLRGIVKSLTGSYKKR